MGGNREDGLNLMEQIKGSHTVLTKKEELSTFDTTNKGKVVGLFADEHLRDERPDNHSSEPTTSEMLDFAINRVLWISIKMAVMDFLSWLRDLVDQSRSRK